MDNFTKYTSRMELNIEYKTILLPLIPQGEVKILDLGGGTGALSKMIKISNPLAEVHLADSSTEMLELAEENKSADKYFNVQTDEVPKDYDAIVMCSMLHEVPNRKSFVEQITRHLKPGGSIIIRDGFAESEDDNDFVVYKLIDPEDAEDFYNSCKGTMIGKLPITFFGGHIIGFANDVRAFLDTYTWGWDSKPRESQENKLWCSIEEVYDLFGCEEYEECKYDLSSLLYVPICQFNYFDHMSKLIEVKNMWNTHAIIAIKKQT